MAKARGNRGRSVRRRRDKESSGIEESNRAVLSLSRHLEDAADRIATFGVVVGEASLAAGAALGNLEMKAREETTAASGGRLGDVGVIEPRGGSRPDTLALSPALTFDPSARSRDDVQEKNPQIEQTNKLLAEISSKMDRSGDSTGLF